MGPGKPYKTLVLERMNANKSVCCLALGNESSSDE
jgi:hypothetical protein